jgi:predicted O-methyltransferase YrrM
MKTRNEMVRAIDSALQQYAHEINWDYHPRSETYWNFEGAINYSLIRQTNAKNIIEFGTGSGASTRFLAEAAKKNGGHVTTVELGDEVSKKAQEFVGDMPVIFIVSDCQDYKLDDDYDFVFQDATHEGYIVRWYWENIIPRIHNGWFVVHDIDIGQDIINSRTDAEYNEFPRVFLDKYVTARQMYGHTAYRPPFEGYDSGWMNGSAYMWFQYYQPTVEPPVLRLQEFNTNVNYEHYGPMLFMIPFLHSAKVIVETGLMYGNSTNLFLTSLSNLPNAKDRVLHTYEIDIGNEACMTAIERTKSQHYLAQWVLHGQDSIQGGREWNGPPIDFLYLDSDHGIEHVYNELNVWTPHLTPTAIVVSDDTWVNDGPDLALLGMRKFISEHPEWHEFTFTYPKGQTVMYR